MASEARPGLRSKPEDRYWVKPSLFVTEDLIIAFAK